MEYFPEIWPATSVETSVSVSELIDVCLFSDRRAQDSDELPTTTDTPQDRRGWWADFLLEDGDQMGSRLWLLTRGKMNDQVERLAIDYCNEAVAILITDGICARIDFTVERKTEGVDLVAAAYNQDGQKIAENRYASLWEGVE